MLDRLLRRLPVRYSADDRVAANTQLCTAKSGLGLRSGLAGDTQHSHPLRGYPSTQHSLGSRLVPAARSR